MFTGKYGTGYIYIYGMETIIVVSTHQIFECDFIKRMYRNKTFFMLILY